MTWTAHTPEGNVGFDGALTGDSLAADAVRDFLADDLGEPLKVTPTGPVVARDVDDELAVLAAVGALYPGAAFDGDAVDLTFGAPPGAVF